MLLCPAPATTMSKRSSLEVCGPSENGVTARGASAVAFTNSRRLMVLIGAPPLNQLLCLLHYFLDASSEVLQHDRRRVSPGSSRNRSARMSRRPRLVQAGNRHSMLRPAQHGAHRTGLRRSRSAGMTSTVPVVRVHALQIKRTFDDTSENLVICQIGREPPQKFQIRV